MRTDKHSLSMKDVWLEGKWLRVFEIALIILLLAAAPVLVIASRLNEGDSQVVADDPNVSAQAYVMPNDGWAPMTVYFSAMGSTSLNGDILRYEWDLDGNGAFETDATANGGYASYTYSKPRDYIISLRVTDANGGTAVASTVVSVRHPASSSVDYWTVFDDSRVRRIDVSLDQADWNQMWADVESKHQAKADAVVFGEELEDVGFRMRGQFSLRMSGDKKPWKIDTDAYIADQEFHNLRQLMLLNNIRRCQLAEGKTGL